MTNKDAILKSLKFIEDNLKEDIQVIHIAESAYCSLYHFIRLFQSITGYSPKKYLHLRRLTETVHELRKTDKKIAEIAYDYHFGSHESFTRAFKKHFNMNPTDVRNNHNLTVLDLTPPISKSYIYQSDKVRNQEPELVYLREKYLVGHAYFFGEDEEINDLTKEWTLLYKARKLVPDRMQPELLYQVQFWSDNQDIGGMYFYMGMEVKHLKTIHPEFVVKIIPEGNYLKFIHKGLANKVGYTYQYIYNQYLPDTDYKLTQPFNFEHYGEKCLGPYNEQSESEIYIPVEIQTE